MRIKGTKQSTIFMKKFLERFVLILILVSCVGTVEDKNPETTIASPAASSPMSFTGIDRAIPIAEDKVEVYFFPASGPLQRDLTYMINYDGLANPITVSGAYLRPDYRGLLMTTITGLQNDTNYLFEVQVKNNLTGDESSNKINYPAKTFANITSDFSGIATVKNVAGADGLTSLRVEWPEAYRGNPLLPPTEKDVIEYEVVLIDADTGSPADFDNSQAGLNRKVFPVPANVVSYVANGLNAGTKYFVRVRAIHHGASVNSFDPSYLKEQNNKYIELETLSGQPPEFDPADRAMIRAPGAAGQTAIDILWGDVTGAFDHYRIYYTVTGDLNLMGTYVEADCDPTKTYGGVFNCKKVDFSLNGSTITDLNPLTTYKARIIICRDPTCNTRFFFNDDTEDTSPPIALFGGIVDIEGARDSNGLDYAHIIMEPPQMDTGVMEGIAVKVFTNTDLGINADYFLNLPDLNEDGSFDDDISNLPPGATAEPGSGLTVLDFDFKTSEEIVIRGIDPLTTFAYSFMLVPYVFSGGQIELHESNMFAEAFVPSIIPPTDLEFQGINSIECDTATQSVKIEWVTPEAGIYSNFKVFWIQSSSFDFGSAKSQASGYSEALVEKSATEYTVPALASGTYSFGVLSYFPLTNSYSTVNTNVFQINIPGNCF